MLERMLRQYDLPTRKGPGRTNQRLVLDAVILRLRTGCQWNRLPKRVPGLLHRPYTGQVSGDQPNLPDLPVTPTEHRPPRQEQ